MSIYFQIDCIFQKIRKQLKQKKLTSVLKNVVSFLNPKTFRGISKHCRNGLTGIA